MAWTFLVLWLVTLFVLIRVSLRDGAVAELQSLLRMADQPKKVRGSIESAKVDRMIRDTDHEMFPDEDHKHVQCIICGPGPLLQGLVPSEYQHPFFKDERIQYSDGYGMYWRNELQPVLAEYADVVSSEVVIEGKPSKLHTIMLDIDMPITVVESSTAGHHHLYIDHLVTWRQYKPLLKAMRNCGLIERGFYTSSVSRRATNLRPPWVKKLPGGPIPKPKRTWLRKGK